MDIKGLLMRLAVYFVGVGISSLYSGRTPDDKILLRYRPAFIIWKVCVIHQRGR